MARKSPLKMLRLALLPFFLASFIGFALHSEAQNTAADFSKGSIQIGYDNNACDASLEGTIRYNSASATGIEFCGPAAGPTGCPTKGNLCSDGTYYAGLSPDGNQPLYVADSASQVSDYSWNNGTSNWIATGATSTDDGDGNTALLASLSDIGSPYIAADYCDQLVANGYGNWHLPARNELNLIYNSGSPIAGFDTSGKRYWSSTEGGTPTSYAKQQNFSTGTIADSTKSTTTNMLVRCVRFDNPYSWSNF